MAGEWRRGPYTIDTDRARLDVAMIHGFLATSDWAAGIPREVVERSIAGSPPFGLYEGDRQIGFARVITDRATFAYLADLFVLAEYRGRGLGRWLVETMLAHPELQGLRRWLLATRDAHALYRGFGFAELAEPGVYMTRRTLVAYPQGNRPGAGEAG
jgi:GNAT superfamily N-acetyltransferase